MFFFATPLQRVVKCASVQIVPRSARGRHAEGAAQVSVAGLAQSSGVSMLLPD
jgi:hypothetical protein